MISQGNCLNNSMSGYSFAFIIPDGFKITANSLFLMIGGWEPYQSFTLMGHSSHPIPPAGGRRDVGRRKKGECAQVQNVWEKQREEVKFNEIRDERGKNWIHIWQRCRSHRSSLWCVCLAQTWQTEPVSGGCDHLLVRTIDICRPKIKSKQTLGLNLLRPVLTV